MNKKEIITGLKEKGNYTFQIGENQIILAKEDFVFAYCRFVAPK